MTYVRKEEWDAVKWDGTNLQAIKDIVGPGLTRLYISDSDSLLFVHNYPQTPQEVEVYLNSWVVAQKTVNGYAWPPRVLDDATFAFDFEQA